MPEVLLECWVALTQCDSFAERHKSQGHRIHPDSNLGEHPVPEFSALNQRNKLKITSWTVHGQ